MLESNIWLSGSSLRKAIWRNARDRGDSFSLSASHHLSASQAVNRVWLNFAMERCSISTEREDTPQSTRIKCGFVASSGSRSEVSLRSLIATLSARILPSWVSASPALNLLSFAAPNVFCISHKHRHHTSSRWRLVCLKSLLLKLSMIARIMILPKSLPSHVIPANWYPEDTLESNQNNEYPSSASPTRLNTRSMTARRDGGGGLPTLRKTPNPQQSAAAAAATPITIRVKSAAAARRPGTEVDLTIVSMRAASRRQSRVSAEFSITGVEADFLDAHAGGTNIIDRIEAGGA
ncbi:hypothetical protein BDV96DRAFT_603505 [Lophiotrema nucula]|uniref:Uncharacterized protein n=1 Tax=Lophiotrema nucula TaxID=690887 RepID=A0A6A5YWG9_9PLEO|nr:hypothetical protein BDV96DRAFT_603505 [Lophiotrema nucula]